MFTVEVRTLFGESHAFVFIRDVSVRIATRQILAFHKGCGRGWEFEQCYLIFKGKRLAGDRRLSDYINTGEVNIMHIIHIPKYTSERDIFAKINDNLSVINERIKAILTMIDNYSS